MKIIGQIRSKELQTIEVQASSYEEGRQALDRQNARRLGAPAHPDGKVAVADEPKRRFLTAEQVAEELNVGLRPVRGLLKTGELRGIQVGGRGLWRVGVQDLEDYISQAYSVTADRVAAGEIAEYLSDG
ncbi:helix-turn-helix domain-containing protein [Arthrobacter sp. W4I7]|uniref:helix-turn-helix domain-containing protein n=1 Tax=Arthrobacter sp. W4I7 TaxID=3042296 RepID=UPI0027D8FFD8|nr:helix-turn-helix domain-containing protein [Arthrobacter sp. W4I7]